jgi:muramidase (phage lysozyme)
MSANLRAFLALIRWCEGTSGPYGYQTLFGGETFDSFADHPRRVVRKTIGGQPISSSAAGAYQFLQSTWDDCVKALKLKDFSPESQDQAAIYLIKRRGALEDVEAGRLEQALAKCAKEWASLPGSPYGQPTKTLDACRAMYLKVGGYLESADVQTTAQPEQPAAPIREAVDPIYPPFKPASLRDIVTGKDKPMAGPLTPFLLPAFEVLANTLPTLIRKYGSPGSQTAERNAQAAEVVLPIVKEALGAKNEQEVVERVLADPAAVQVADKAVQENWLAIEEVGGGVAAARDFALKVDEKPFYERAIFWMSLIFLAHVSMLYIDFLFVHPGNYTNELRTQIVTATLAILSMVGVVWFGTTVRNAAKDDAIKALAQRQP